MRYSNTMWAAIFIVALAMPHVARGATYTWTGNDIDSNWASPGNWDNGTPVDGSNLVFPLGANRLGNNNNLPATTSFSAVTISGSGYTLSGNVLFARSITTTNATGSNSVIMGVQGDSLTINSSTAGTSFSLQGISVTQSVTFTGAGTTTVNSFINGGVFGTNTLIKDGAGVLILKSPSTVTATGYVGNGWLGSVEVKAGTLQLGQSDQFPRLSSVIVDAGGTLDLQDFSDACGNLAGAGAVNRHGIANSTHLFTVGANNADVVFSGTLSDSGNFQKVGTGALTMSGNNPFNGLVLAEGGVLSITGTMSAASFQPKNKGTLNGTGSIGSVSVLAGTLGAGTPAATGILNTQNVAFNGAGTLSLRLNGATAGAGYDQIKATGSVDVTNATLNLTVGSTSNVGDKVTLIDNDGADAIVGTFAGLTEGMRFASSGNEFTISYIGGDGNDVVLTNVSGSASGTIRDASGAPIVGVSVSNGAISTLTAADGTYAINLADGPITITPTKTGYSFNPPSRQVTGAGGSITGQDFTGVLILVSVSGNVALADGSGLSGVVVSDGVRFGTSDSSGNFKITGVPYGQCTLSPGKAGYFFTPPSMDVTVQGDTSGVNFVAGRSSADQALPLTVKKLSFKLNFAKSGNDTFALTGSLSIPAGFITKGQQVTLLIGNITKNFTLDAKGNAKSGSDSFKVAIKSKKGVVAAQTSAFTVKGGKGDYVSGLAGTGVSNTNASSMPVTIPVLLIFNNSTFGKNQPQVFSAKVGKNGSTK
jgi:autotransporter-associated beta strand protein